ncbi:ankyrin repeat-containing domain protein [Xylaria cf. heliscus]|nr:ankyrin repeat-containing domain protein [Xylaria cf. heliscus]
MKPRSLSSGPDVSSLDLDDSNLSDPGPLRLPHPEVQLASKQPKISQHSDVDQIQADGREMLERISRLTDQDGNPRLHIAIASVDLELLSSLLESELIPIDESQDGFNPLHLALIAGNIDALAILLAHRANRNRHFQQIEILPLHYTVIQELPDMTFALIQGGADVNTTGPDGSVLKIAVAGQQESSVLMLLSAGACPDEDKNLLHIAARGKSTKILEALLDKGLDINKRDDSERTDS